MTKVQAEAFQGIAWRWRSSSQEATAYAALLDCAWTISPRVEDGPKREEQDFSDTVVLDLAGCEKLFGSREKIANDLIRVASGVGLTANVAIAGNTSAAITGAQGFTGVTVITDGQEGLRWWRLAQGTDAHPLIAKDFPSNFEEYMDLDSPVELLEPLFFVLNRLLEQLCARQRMHILVIGEVKVTLKLERNDSRRKEPFLHVRTIRLPVAARDGKLLLVRARSAYGIFIQVGIHSFLGYQTCR